MNNKNYNFRLAEEIVISAEDDLNFGSKIISTALDSIKSTVEEPTLFDPTGN